jgi:hypothetical protein
MCFYEEIKEFIEMTTDGSRHSTRSHGSRWGSRACIVKCEGVGRGDERARVRLKGGDVSQLDEGAYALHMLRILQIPELRVTSCPQPVNPRNHQRVTLCTEFKFVAL